MLSRHRVLIALLSALAVFGFASATPAGAAGAEMEWTALDRFGGDKAGIGQLEDGDPLTPAALDTFAVRVVPSAAICERLEEAEWTLDGEAARPLPGSGCSAVFWLRGEGAHRIAVRLGEGKPEVAEVEIKDELVIAIGDSVAAGEGNPEGSERWLDVPCHRSAAAGFEVAARRLADSDPHRSITFVSLACSGAEVQQGLLGRYGGVAPQGTRTYLPQVLRLKRLAAARAGAPRKMAVDAVLVSVGANDLTFSGVVFKCAASPGDCGPAEEQRVRGLLEGLDGSYDELGEALNAAAPGAPVFVTEYFDPTHDSDAEFCRHSLAFTSQAESKWAYERLLRPLNGKIETAAVRNGWTRIGDIAADFERHGICADQRWVRRFGESIFNQGDWLGTLHPNEEGQRRIARRVASEIAVPLGFAKPPEETEGEEEGDKWTKEDWIATGVAAVVPQAVVGVSLSSAELSFTWRHALALYLTLPLLIGLLWLAARALMLMRATWPDDPVANRESPRFRPRGRRRPLTGWSLLLIVVGALVVFAAIVVVAGLVGRAILWLRFWSAHLPADEAVSQVSGDELVSTGSVALVIFVGLGLAAAAISWLLDGKGREVRTTRRGLVAIGLAELVAVLLIGHYRTDQALEILAGLVAAALMIHYLVEQVLEWRRKQPPRRPGDSQAEEVWTKVKDRTRDSIHKREGRAGRLWKLVPFLLLGVALYFSFRAEGVDRFLEVLAPYLTAAILFAAPGGMAAPGVRWGASASEKDALRAPRIALSVTGIAIVSVLLFRDERWLAAVALTAAVLGLLCLAVAAASKERFGPYGVAVLVSVPLFAAAAAFAHGLDSPELQPVAVILDDGEAVCGAYVGESDERLWLARLVLDERAGAHRPERGSISPLDADRVEARALGSLEPVDLIDARARELRDRLLDEHGEEWEQRTPRCVPPPPAVPVAVPVEDDWQRALAEKFQPNLVLDRDDGFWPVPVRTLFSVRDRRATICRRVAAGDEGCLRLGTPGEFPWTGGEGEWLEYPAANEDPDEQHDQAVDALGSADPARSATEYYLVHGRPGDGEPVSIQYWFFYPFNYQPAGDSLNPGGYHEGDFEAIAVLLSAEGEPRYVWMNRHDNEGRAFPWADSALTVEGGHPEVFAARGSHATYENCEKQRRPLQLEGLIDDRPACEERQRLRLLPEETPLVNLSRVGWACWQGLFGHRKGKRGVYEQLPSLINDAPKSPLWQQKFGEEKEEPCRGVADPGDRDGPGEEVLGEGEVPAKLRDGASPLERTIDECSDWEAPATMGIYMVACDQTALTAYVESGLEEAGPVELRVQGRLFDDLDRGFLAVPAVRRDRNRTYLDDWRITAQQPATITVYATCPSGDEVVGALFEDVPVGPGSALTLRDEGPERTWLLTRADGTPAARALPFETKVSKGRLVERERTPEHDLACGR
jgi:lysophospholipase L1-like esterase